MYGDLIDVLRTTMDKFFNSFVPLVLLFTLVIKVSIVCSQSNDTNNQKTSHADTTLVDSFCSGNQFKCFCSPIVTDRMTIDCNNLNITEVNWLSNENRGKVMVSISFDNNHLRKIVELNASNAIVTLSFNGNNIEEISPYAFQGLTNMKELSIRDNQLIKIGHHDLNAIVTKISTIVLPLEVLDISDNILVHVDDDAFEQLPHLRILRLSNNPIHTLDLSTIQALNSLHQLQVLDLSNTQLHYLPVTQLINPLRNLLELDLSYNIFYEMPEALQFAKELVHLNFDGNPMKELNSMSFVGLVSLQRLDINNMTDLEIIYRGTFTKLVRLTELRCNNNINLSGIETGAFFDGHGHEAISLKTVLKKFITLKNNNFISFNQETFSWMSNVTLDLDDNPLDCSCHLAWLSESHGNLICKTPQEFSGNHLKDVDFSKVPCDKRTSDDNIQSHQTIYRGLAVTIGVLLVVIIGVLLFVIIRGSKITYPNAHYRRAQSNEACNFE